LLTYRVFRLNSRESILERAATQDANPGHSTFYVSSITTSQQKGTNQESMPRLGQASAQESVDLHQSTSRDFPPCKYDDNMESSQLNVEKSVRSLRFVAIPELI
jgi:hypothetical protein